MLIINNYNGGQAMAKRKKKNSQDPKKIEPYIAACIQPIVHICQSKQDIKKNLTRALEMIDFTAGYYWEFPCKLIALPEYFLQGVTTSGKGEKKKKQRMGVAIEIPSKEIDILGQKAKEYGLYLACGGIVEKVPDWPDYWFNTGIIIAPTGEVVLKYRKWHVPASLGSGTSPHDMFDKYKEKFGGDLKSLFPIVDTEIGKLGVFIGYDSFTPEVARALAFNGGEVLLHLAAIPEMEGVSDPWDIWTLCHRARAHDNLTYVVAPDWGEVDFKFFPKNFCPGRSQIVDYNGTVIAQADYPGEAVIAAVIDIEALRRRRAMAAHNMWPDLRTEPFKEIYEHPIYPPNRFLKRPPESLAEKLEGEIQGFNYLYERGTYTPPSADMPSLSERMKRAQAMGTLKK
jgi:predicted amidohydrolase